MRSARFISMIVLAAAVAVAAALAVENLVLASISLARGEWRRTKNPAGQMAGRIFYDPDMLDSAGDFTGTQTPGTNVHMARGTVHNRLDPLDIGLPSAVGPAVGVGNLDAKGNTLVAKLTFSHPLHLLAVRDIAGAKAPCGMIPEFDTKCKRKFQNHRNFFCLVKAGGLYYNYPIYAPRFRGARGRDRR